LIHFLKEYDSPGETTPHAPSSRRPHEYFELETRLKQKFDTFKRNVNNSQHVTITEGTLNTLEVVWSTFLQAETTEKKPLKKPKQKDNKRRNIGERVEGPFFPEDKVIVEWNDGNFYPAVVELVKEGK
jgi:hypothetical protein